MREITFYLEDSEFDKFMNYVKKSLKSVQNLQSKQLELVNNTCIYGLTDEHQQIVEQRIARHISGESKSFSWEEVKANARQALQDKKK